MTRRQWFTVVFTSALFLTIYPACNWITAQRSDVSVWVFSWERHIPVIPWTIVPYWSLDVFFAFAPFLTKNENELRALTKQLSFSIAAGAVCFLLVPLRYGLERPRVEGMWAPLFNVLHTMDKPHNLFPSLHIALRTILAVHYVRHTRGLLQWLTHSWFVLIGLSTLTTRQHHVIDIAGGFMLGLACVHLFPAVRAAPSNMLAPNRRAGMYYAAGSLLCLIGTRSLWPWSVLLYWPALSLGMMSCACFGAGAAVYGKLAHGRLPLAARLLLAPVRFGQWLSWLYYRRRSAPWDALTPNVRLGALLNPREAAAAVSAGVTAVLDLTCEFHANPVFASRTNYRNIPLLDLTAPDETATRAAVAFIEEASLEGIVLIHCKAGYSRTAAAAGAWLLLTGRADSAVAAIAMMKDARPGLIVRPEVVRLLEELTSVAGVRTPRARFG